MKGDFPPLDFFRGVVNPIVYLARGQVFSGPLRYNSPLPKLTSFNFSVDFMALYPNT